MSHSKMWSGGIRTCSGQGQGQTPGGELKVAGGGQVSHRHYAGRGASR